MQKDVRGIQRLLLRHDSKNWQKPATSSKTSKSALPTISEAVVISVLTRPDQAPEQWRFTGLLLNRAKVAVRLHRDLGVNFAGAALALVSCPKLASNVVFDVYQLCRTIP